MHGNSLEIMERLLRRYEPTPAGLTVADVGSYDVNGTYRELVMELGFESYTGIDIRGGPNVDQVVDEYSAWPSQCGMFDVVISGQTLEHTKMPWRWMNQVA